MMMDIGKPQLLEELEHSPAYSPAKPLLAKATLSGYAAPTSPENIIEVSREKIAQLLLLVTTTTKSSEGISSKTAVSVLCEYFRNIYKTRTIQRAAKAVASLVANGEDAAIVLYSPKGKPLLRLSAQKNSQPIKLSEEVAMFNSKITPLELIAQIVKSGAAKIIIQNKAQLLEVAPRADRLGLERIYVPKRLLQYAPTLKQIKPMETVLDIQIKEQHKNKNASENKNNILSSSISSKIPALDSQSLVSQSAAWQNATLPSITALATSSAIKMPIVRSSIRNEAEELQNARILMQRLAASIDADIRTSISEGFLRDALKNLGQSVCAIRSAQPELHIYTEKETKQPSAKKSVKAQQLVHTNASIHTNSANQSELNAVEPEEHAILAA